MSLVGDVDKIAETAIKAMPVEVVSVDELGIYKLAFVLGLIVLGGAIYFFYATIMKKVNAVKGDLEKSKSAIYLKFDRARESKNAEFKEVKDNCDAKDRRLTAVETKVSDMRGNLEITVKDMIQHKSETDVRVSTLEKTVNDKLLPKLDDINAMVNKILGKLSND